MAHGQHDQHGLKSPAQVFLQKVSGMKAVISPANTSPAKKPGGPCRSRHRRKRTSGRRPAFRPNHGAFCESRADSPRRRNSRQRGQDRSGVISVTSSLRPNRFFQQTRRHGRDKSRHGPGHGHQGIEQGVGSRPWNPLPIRASISERPWSRRDWPPVSANPPPPAGTPQPAQGKGNPQQRRPENRSKTALPQTGGHGTRV